MKACHVLPCRVEHQGPIDVDKLQITPDSDAFKCKLRGRTLTGRRIDLAEYGMTAYTRNALNKNNQNSDTEKSNTNELIFWSYSKNQPDLGQNVADLLKFSNAMDENK